MSERSFIFPRGTAGRGSHPRRSSISSVFGGRKRERTSLRSRRTLRAGSRGRWAGARNGVRGRRRGGARRGSLVGSSGTPGELPGGAASAVPWAGAAALPSLAGTAGIPKWALRTHAGKVRGRTTAEARTLTVKGDS